jgi:4'-phosphopantetheinyl transferase
MPTQPPLAPEEQRGWAPGPPRPTLTEGAIHVWRADLANVNDDLVDLLCAEERARAERFHKQKDGRVWSRSRGVLRALLGRYLESDPTALNFSTETHGKPSLEGPLSFNLSHSGGLALYAICETLPVGVDLELVGSPRDVVALAARAFGQAQARRLSALDPVARQREFLRLWVRHEAQLKCLGRGLDAGDREASEDPPWTTELDLGPGAVGAVAAMRAPAETRCWDWAGC